MQLGDKSPEVILVFLLVCQGSWQLVLDPCFLLAKAKHMERKKAFKVRVGCTGTNILTSVPGQNGTRSTM